MVGYSATPLGEGIRVQMQDELATSSASVSVMPLYDPGDT